MPPLALREPVYGLYAFAVGSVLELIVNGGVVVTTDKVSLAVAVCAVGLPESFTMTVREKVPLAVGVPKIVPVEGEMAIPVGRLPEVIDQV